MASDTSLNIVVTAQDNASATLQGIRSSLKDMSPAFREMALVGGIAFGAITAIGVSALAEFEDSEKKAVIANTALTNGIKALSDVQLLSLMTQLGGTGTALEALQGVMHTVGEAALGLGFDDDEARLAFAKLYQVSRDVTQAQNDMKLAMDLSAFSGRTLADSADAITKVHAGATRVLKEFGIELDASATSAEALSALQTVTAGSADALSKTIEGQTRVMNEQFNNLKEGIGAALAPALISLLQAITPVIASFTEWASANPQLLATLLLVGGALSGLVLVIGVIGLALPGIITLIGALGVAFMFLATTPIGLVLVGLAALVVAGTLLYQNWEAVEAAMKQAWDGIKAIFQDGVNSVLARLQPLFDTIERLRSAAQSVGGMVGGFVGNVGGGFNAIGSMIHDGIVQNGRVITTDPSDFIIATKNPGSLGSGAINININGAIFSEDAARVLGDIIYKQLALQMRGA